MTTKRSNAACSKLYSAYALRCALLAALAGCAAEAQGPYFHDEQFLVLGVDLDAETRTLQTQMEKNRFYLLRRVRGQNFAALGFGDARDVAQKVRVITRRGIALALDAQVATALTQGIRYELIDPKLAGTQDADGDGFEEVFVSERHDPAGASCVLVYRVRDSGFVDAVDDFALPPELAASVAFRGASLCAPAPAASGVAPAESGASESGAGESGTGPQP